MKVRRNALHRFWEGNKGRLSLYGMRIDPDERVLHTPNLSYNFLEYLSSAEIKKICVSYMRMVDESKKITHEIFAQKMQDQLGL